MEKEINEIPLVELKENIIDVCYTYGERRFRAEKRKNDDKYRIRAGRDGREDCIVTPQSFDTLGEVKAHIYDFLSRF